MPGGAITTWQAGTGPAVLILHGGPGLSDYTAPLAAEFTDAFRVIRSAAAVIPRRPMPDRAGMRAFPLLERPGAVRQALRGITAAPPLGWEAVADHALDWAAQHARTTART